MPSKRILDITAISRHIPKTDKKQRDKDFAVLLALFWEFIEGLRTDGGDWSLIEKLAAARADQGIRHALRGFGYSYEEAIELLESQREVSGIELQKRNIIIAAIDNIADFATVEEYHLATEIIDTYDIEEFEERDWDEILDTLQTLCYKYNYRYADVENLDIEYAMGVAAYLISLSLDTTLMYMTMGDERVRPWHLQFEGFTAPRSQFPSWLIPPIEHQCRCYLVEEPTAKITSSVMAKQTDALQMPDWFDRTFKESVVNGGRIFSDEHPYFQVEEAHIKELRKIASNIKSKYFG